MMGGKPQTLVSKFRVSYSLMLNLVESGSNVRETFVENSMYQTELEERGVGIQQQLQEKEQERDRLLVSFETCGLPMDTVQRYLVCKKERAIAVNKRRKELDRELEAIRDECRNIDTYCASIEKFNTLCGEIEQECNALTCTRAYFHKQMNTVLLFLEEKGFIEQGKRTNKGHIATHLREIHCLAMAEQIANNALDALSVEEMIALFSCFTQVTVSDDFRSFGTNIKKLEPILGAIANSLDDCERFETEKCIQTGADDCKMQYDLIDTMIQWVRAETMQECKYILHKLEETKGIFLGEFVKACLKINNIGAEMEKVAEYLGNMSLLQKLREIPERTQKYVATNQSLYV
jgi:superfamily II RNA helicase